MRLPNIFTWANPTLPVPETVSTYQESLLHWIWEQQHFELSRLQTTRGLPLTILQPGTLNNSDGPDFLRAKIRIGSMDWFGDVEIHWKEQDWNLHRHYNDSNFNRVILHVIYHNDNKELKPVLRQDSTAIQTLHLKPYLQEPLQAFLNRFGKSGTLPCSGLVSFISEKAFRKQLESARKSYFEQKVNDLLHFYDPDLPPSRAWLNMLAVGLFDGLGITYNREPMRKLCMELSSRLHSFSSLTELTKLAISVSGINSAGQSCKFGWRHKGCRPANHPEIRIRQAVKCLWYLHQLSFEQWLKRDILSLWKEMLLQVQTRPGIGTERAGILYGTVWLPSCFVLGNLFGSRRIYSSAYDQWLNHQVKLPQSLLTAFDDLDISEDIYHNNLGTIHQLRSYCKPRKCAGCEVFKSVISS